MAERWATFDCYGTLIDWNAGIAAELERLITVWVNRLGERPDPPPTSEIPDLGRLPDVLEELLPR